MNLPNVVSFVIFLSQFMGGFKTTKAGDLISPAFNMVPYLSKAK
jgi:hypothetical protein